VFNFKLVRGEKEKMTKNVVVKLVSFSLILVFLLSTTNVMAAENVGTYIEDTIDIGPGKHYAIYYNHKTCTLEAVELPDVRLPSVAHKAIAEAPVWIKPKLRKAFEDLTRGDVRVASHSKPALADLNGDGLYDLLIGNVEGTLTYYENTGTFGFPQWTRNERVFAGIGVHNYSAPSLADLNKDGLLDLAVGCGDGKIYFWWGSKNKENLVWERDDRVFAEIDIGNYSTPTFADLNADGLIDLIIGSETGELFCYKNVGRPKKPAWMRDDTLLMGVSAPPHSAPAFADLAANGRLYLFIGAADGKIYVFKNTGTAKEPVWTADETLMQDVMLAGHSSPSFGDIDNDGRIDLLIGSLDGYIYAMGNYGTPFVPDYPLWKSGAEETLISTILWGPGYYPDIDRLVAVNEPNTMKYVEIYSNLILSAEESYVDEIAYCIANEQISHLKMLADNDAEYLFELNAKEIYNMAPKLKYVKLVEGKDYTTLAFRQQNGDWVEIPREIYYQRLVMLNRYILMPWAWPYLYEGNWYMTYLPWDTTYNVSLYERVKDAETVTEAMWNIALWIKVDIGAWWRFGTKYWKPPGWYNIYKQLINPEWTILCGEFSIITMVAGRAVLIPVANTLNLGEDHQWDEFFNEELRWVHIDTSATAPGDEEGLKNYFDNPMVYEVAWGKNVSAVMWWEQGGRYDHITSRTEVTGYTDTSLVVFNVVDLNGKPIDGARIEAWSHWIEPIYGIPLIAFANYTNLEGEASMHLGGNEYTFVAITRIGHAVLRMPIEEGTIYHIEFRMDKALPKLGEASLEARKPKGPGRLNLEFEILSGHQENPHWIHILWVLFGWEDYWYYKHGINLDAYIVDEEDYKNFASGLDFNAYAMLTQASEGELTEVPINTNAYIVLSNERSLTTTLTVHYKAWISKD
jgi:hypothetical protein